MSQSARSAAVLLVRVGAVAFALTACGYLVVTAQRRANPSPAEVPASAEALSTDSAPAAADETFLQGSKSLVLEPTDAVAVESAADVADTESGTVFLSSSKTLNWTPPPYPPLLQVGPDGAATPVEPVFLPSSKVKIGLNPLQPQELVPGTTTTSKRTFLPSSKSLRIEPTAPKTKPAPAPTDPPKSP